MRTVELSIGTVEIVDVLTWGMQEEIRSAMLSGFKLSGLSDKEKQNIELNPEVLTKAKYKALELCIRKITLKDGKTLTYSQEWMNDLSIEDGDKLFAEVNDVTSPKKK